MSPISQNPPAGAVWRGAWQRWLTASAGLLDATVSLAPRSLGRPGLLFVLALGIYAFTHLYRLADYPIYFFGDEAAQALFAERLIANGFRDKLGITLPMYVDAAAMRWTPMFSMYFHALTLSLFGKSVFVTRATSAAVSVLAALAASLALKRVFKSKLWWSGTLLAGAAPAFFLHSRTAFETVMAASFYGMFLACYLLYRCDSPMFIYPAVVFGAAAFYTYSNAQVVTAACSLLLLISDAPYHWRNRRTLLGAAGLALLLAVPLLAFRLKLPEATGDHLRMINSYWLHPIPVWEKARIFLQKYAYGLSPGYWFWPNEHDLARHRMDGIGHLHPLTFPLFLLGLGTALWHVRRAPYRAVLLAGMAAPTGAALLEIGITRVLFFTVPVVILMGLGLDWLWARFEGHTSALLGLQRLGEWGIFLVLAAGNLLLLRAALVDGPTWSQDYGLYGMQYGARQIFEQTIPALARRYPTAEILVTSVWANGADNFIQFFLDDQTRQQVRMDGIESYLFKQRPLYDDMIFIMTAAEYQKALDSPKLKPPETLGIIPYPNGEPGFILARLGYVGNAAEVFAAEKEARHQLVEAAVLVDGETILLRHSQTDMGEPALMFDGDEFTLMRGLEANPFILEIEFPTSRVVSGLEANFGLMDVILTVHVYPPEEEDASQPAASYELTRERVTDPLVHMRFENPPALIERMRIEITNPWSGEVANIHIRELEILP